MKKTKLLVFALMQMVIGNVVLAQQEWEPQTHITGYLVTEMEWVGLDNLKKDFGMGLGEAGFLASYKPLEKVEFKGTFVYKPGVLNIHEVIVEAYGMYKMDKAFNFGAGRFLTPLSPVNLYFYAPLNHSATTPLLVSHHAFFPQSLSGFQVNGVLGDVKSFEYNLTFGNYLNVHHRPSGVLNFHGLEESRIIFGDQFDLSGNVEDAIDFPLGGTFRLAYNHNNWLTMGYNMFLGNSILTTYENFNIKYVDSYRKSFGTDIHVSVSDFKFNAEYWFGEASSKEHSPELSEEYEGYYAELIYSKGKVTPFLKYDYINDIKLDAFRQDLTEKDNELSAFTMGMSYRPFFELMTKLEYKRYFHNQVDFDNVLLSFVFSF
ncbi:hypothetical protein E9993_00115 [Labilibacter sediminis]|nr:hypothetical protein E9993_00115 [Labilibacter sediminis]